MFGQFLSCFDLFGSRKSELRPLEVKQTAPPVCGKFLWLPVRIGLSSPLCSSHLLDKTCRFTATRVSCAMFPLRLLALIFVSSATVDPSPEEEKEKEDDDEEKSRYDLVFMRGDLLEVPRTLFTHFGIYLGGGRWVWRCALIGQEVKMLKILEYFLFCHVASFWCVTSFWPSEIFFSIPHFRLTFLSFYNFLYFLDLSFFIIYF